MSNSSLSDAQRQVLAIVCVEHAAHIDNRIWLPITYIGQNNSRVLYALEKKGMIKTETYKEKGTGKVKVSMLHITVKGIVTADTYNITRRTVLDILVNKLKPILEEPSC